MHIYILMLTPGLPVPPLFYGCFYILGLPPAPGHIPTTRWIHSVCRHTRK